MKSVQRTFVLVPILTRDSNYKVLSAPQKNAAARKRLPKSPAKPKPFRFGLKSLFFLLAAAGVLCAALRSLVQGDASMFLGIGAFCYGGIVAIPCYAFVGSLMVLSTTTTRGQRAGEIFAAAVGATAWISFIIAALHPWPQLCVAYSLVVIAIIVWLVRLNWKPEDGPSPEGMLQRLSQVKQDARAKHPKRGPEP